jgi:hypothetical protein
VGRLLQPRFQQYRLGPARDLARHLAPRHRLGRKGRVPNRFARPSRKIREGRNPHR